MGIPRIGERTGSFQYEAIHTDGPRQTGENCIGVEAQTQSCQMIPSDT